MMKFRYIFLPLYIIWTIDFLSTFIGFQLINGLQEVNPIGDWCINLGWYGWILVYGYVMFLVIFFSTLIYYGYKLDVLFWRKEGICLYFAYIATGILVVMELCTIISNLILITKYI